MKKLLFILLLLSGCMQLKEPFCGTSAFSSCQIDRDCLAGGCSSQICQSKADEPMITTCEYRECYNAEKYALDCRCIENKCQWR